MDSATPFPGSPLVSVITVCFNNPLELELTLNSLKPALPTAEVIVVDGSTTNDCKFVCSRLGWVRSIHEPDDGRFDAMNKGVSLARGSSIIFINSGDQLFDGVRFRQMLLTHSVALRDHILYGDHVTCFAEGNVYCPAPPINARGLRLGTLPSHQAVLIPKRFYDSCLYDLALKMSADTKLMRHAFSSLPAVYIPEALAIFAYGGVSTTSGTWPQVIEHISEAIKAREFTLIEAVHEASRLIARKLLKAALGSRGLQHLHMKRALGRVRRKASHQ